jgi:peptidyl-Lys metalloendopeptidase
MGILVKRSTAKDSDYTIFKPYEKKLVNIKLNNFYLMDKSASYEVSFKGLFRFINENKTLNKSISKIQMKKSNIESKKLTFSFKPQKKKIYTRKVQANYNQCTTSQQSDLDSAHTEAINIARISSDDMDGASVPTSASRYTEWFGAADTTRHNTIKTHYNNLYSALDTQQIIFDCNCSAVDDPSSTYAYVYPDKPYTIYLCGAFWNASLTGTDSKAGTLVHETSHFTVVAGTSDYAYGQSDARNLATTNPDNAINNADSHEYFAENTPFLSMEDSSSSSSSSSATTDDFGNDFDTAYVITATLDGLSISANIEVGDDYDAFKLTTVFDGNLTVYTTGDTDTYGYLYNNEHTLIGENDDMNYDAGEYNFEISKIISAGVYYVKVGSFSDTTGPYVLNFKFTSTDGNTVVSTVITSYILD